jgi:hypothetical protein
VATGKVYVVEDADTSSTPKGPRAEFPGTLQCLIDALDAAAYRSAADTPKAIVIVEGKQRQPIRRFEGGKEVWSASFSDRTARSRSATPACGHAHLLAWARPAAGGPRYPKAQQQARPVGVLTGGSSAPEAARRGGRSTRDTSGPGRAPLGEPSGEPSTADMGRHET